MKKENTLNAEQIKEIVDWLNSEIEKSTKEINRCNAMGNYSREEQARSARNTYFKCLRKLTGEDE